MPGPPKATVDGMTKSVPAPQTREQMERNALRLLCSLLVRPGTHLEICRVLRSSDFLDPLRKAVFEEIQWAGLMSAKQLRASLPALVVGRGSPDFDLDKLLASKHATEAEIEQLFASTLCLRKLGGSHEPALLASRADVQY